MYHVAFMPSVYVWIPCVAHPALMSMTSSNRKYTSGGGCSSDTTTVS